MLAVDTNVVIRYLTRDEPAQAARAARLIDGEDVFVCMTVLLETEWVLRSVYEYNPDQIAAALRGFCGLPRVDIEDAALAARALDAMTAGMDFADALHSGKAAGYEAFVSFDQRLVRALNRLNGGFARAP